MKSHHTQPRKRPRFQWEGGVSAERISLSHRGKVKNFLSGPGGTVQWTGLAELAWGPGISTQDWG